MADKHGSELQKREPREVAQPAEQTRPGPVFTPAVDIFETPNTLTLLADLPGVDPKDLKIDLREGVLTLSALPERQAERKEELLLQEFEPGGYYRQFTLSDAIDQARIEANLKDGVLRLVLPKVEAVKPRQITVKAG
ncbi:MAG TPA: Hsp20/alpha crystallin family protein [Polyangia bacterium]|jgi:HSP20 family molecular chaperone IbpA